MAANIYSWVALATLFLAIAVAPFTRRLRVRRGRPDTEPGRPAAGSGGGTRARAPARDSEDGPAPANDGGRSSGAANSDGLSPAPDNAAERRPAAAGDAAGARPAPADRHLPAAALSSRELRELRLRRSNRWTRFNFALSGVFAALTAGGFVVGYDAYYDPSLALLGAVAFAILFVPVRFPRAVGVPALIVVLALVAASPVLFAEWYSVRGSAPLAAARILSLDGESVRFELVEREQIGDDEIGDGTVHALEGTGLAVGVRVVEVPAQLFFAGADAFARVGTIAGTEPENGDRLPTGDVVERPAGTGVAGRVTGVLESGRIPGVRAREVVVELPRPVLLAEYVLEVDGDGRAAMERISR